MNIVTEDRIKNGEATDQYFVRTEEALAHTNPEVVAEVTVNQFEGEPYVIAGLDEALEILEGLPVTVEALPEGHWHTGGPIMNIEGPYRDFARYETAILGVLSQASGFATAAATVSHEAGDTDVLSFGSRHIHPMLAEYFERSAYIGGVNGYSNVAASNVLPEEPSGTMPHALMLSLGDCEEAWRSFNEAVPDDVPRIVLVDTFTDEVDEAVRACEELGDDLDGVRLDTTGSRRGDFEHIIREVQYNLSKIGRGDVDIYVSGGLDDLDVEELRQYVDGFGIGGHISDAPTIDFSLDIVEREGEPTSKRGKLPGKKVNVEFWTMIEDGEIVIDDSVENARDRCTGVAHNYV